MAPLLLMHPGNTTSTGPALSGPSFLQENVMSRKLEWIEIFAWGFLLLLVPMMLTGGM